MPISTVLNLSARLPMLEPPGLLTAPLVTTTSDYVPARGLTSYLLDGRYSDNFGALTLRLRLEQIHVFNCQNVTPKSEISAFATERMFPPPPVSGGFSLL
jgi:hypothetical protein